MSYNLRIIQEYFQPKIGRKIRIFSLGRKNNILIKKKECTKIPGVVLLGILGRGSQTPDPLFHTENFHFPHSFSDLASKIHTRF